MDAVSTSDRRISHKATARLATADVHEIARGCLESRPPPPSRGTTIQKVTTECPPPIPRKQDAKTHRNLLNAPVPLLQKVGGQIATPEMRPENAVTHVRINLPSNRTSEPPVVPPRTRNSPSSVPRPVPSLERVATHARVSNEYVDTPALPKGKKKAEIAHEQPVIKEPEKIDSIFCQRCGKCKCESCTDPKLPSGKAHLANNIVDYCSCMCCVKGLFYHCASDKESEESDKPCACFSQPHCCGRWTTMAVLSIFLPCLCLYWPLKGCVKVTKQCYSKCMVRGCRCQRDRSAPPQTRHLLLESSESSST